MTLPYGIHTSPEGIPFLFTFHSKNPLFRDGRGDFS
jgi:hypothetical protein